MNTHELDVSMNFMIYGYILMKLQGRCMPSLRQVIPSYTQDYIFRGAGERNRGYALLMTANKPEKALYRAPTFSLLLASHGGISS